MQAPLRPLKAGSIFDVANRRFVALGIEAAHRGGHALRHAYAVRFLAEGLTLKAIAMQTGYAALMFGVCMLACVVPTRRALNIEPTTALRTE